MKVKTSITLSEETLQAIDKAVGSGSNRSQFIEEAVRDSLARRARSVRDARELANLNRLADDLNREMADVLSFQVEI